MNFVKRYFIANGLILWAWELTDIKREHDPTAEKRQYSKAVYEIAIGLFGLPLYISGLVYTTYDYLKTKTE